MNAIELKHKWSLSQSHTELANRMVVSSEDEFKFENIKLIADYENEFGIHLEFVLKNIIFFISSTNAELFKLKQPGFNLSGCVCSIEVTNEYDNENGWFLRLMVKPYNNSSLLVADCVSFSIGPVRGELIK